MHLQKFAMASKPEDRLISWEEVKKHNSASSLWVVIDGKVYDITEFVKEVYNCLTVHRDMGLHFKVQPASRPMAVIPLCHAFFFFIYSIRGVRKYCWNMEVSGAFQ